MASAPPPKRLKPSEEGAEGGGEPVPITLLSGFLGAGKTSMLKHLLHNKQGLRIGVIVNDVAQINIDASLVAVRGGGNVGTDDTVELQNGCACCSAAEELLQSVEKLMDMSSSRGVPWDHIVIEASGVAEPKEIRDNFRNCYESAPEMLRGTMLHTLVTVIDGSTFLSEFQKRNKVEQRADLGADEFTDGGRQVVDLMCEQIEVSDIVVINKTDLISTEELDLLKVQANSPARARSTSSSLHAAFTPIRPAHVRFIFAALFAQETIANLTPLSTMLTSERGCVPPESILGAAKKDGIATLDEEQEHSKLVEHVKREHEARKKEAHSHDHGETCKDAGYTTEHDHAMKESGLKESGHEHGHKEKGHGHEHGHKESGHEHGHKESGHEHDHKESGHEHAHGDGGDCTMCKEGHGHDHGQHGHNHDHSHEHTHSHEKATGREAKRFGITSFCYQRRRPFHPARLMKVIRQLPVRQQQLALADCLGEGSQGSKGEAAAGDGQAGAQSPMCSLIRSKGFVWLSNSHTQIFYWALAGKHFELKQYASWWQTMEDEEWPIEEKEITTIMKDFDGEFGDHRQELVFIGVKMDEEGITKLLDECLLTDQEMDAYRQHWLS
ncbi:MAG: hypothetical protein SGPRY_007463 [Prymnesium sp.]